MQRGPQERRARPVAALLAGALAAPVLAAIARPWAARLWHKDALDYAQIARELAAGHGFASRQAIYALHLRFLADRGLLHAPWPNVHRFPLQAAVLAPAMAAFGPSDAAVLWTGVALAAATVALAFRFADVAVGRWPAIAAALVVALDASLAFEVGAGIPEPVVWLCFLAATYALWRGLERPGVARAALSGALLGLAALARTNALTALPGMLLALASRGVPGRRAKAVALIGATLVVLTPWAVRNARLTGSPTFSLHSYFLVPSNAAPGESKRDYSRPWVRAFVSPLDYAREHPVEVWGKWRTQALAVAAGHPWFAGTAFVTLLAWAGLARRASGALQPVAVVACVGFVANAVLCSLTDANPERYYLFLLPPMAVVAAAVAWRALRVVPWRAARGPALLALALAATRPAGLAATVRSIAEGEAEAPPHEELAVVAARTAPDAIVFSDDSHFVTWTTGRRSIRFHVAPGPDGAPRLALLELDDAFGPIDALYLSRRFLVERGQGELFQRLSGDPAFTARFACDPPLPDGGLFCARRAAAPR